MKGGFYGTSEDFAGLGSPGADEVWVDYLSCCAEGEGEEEEGREVGGG